MRILWSVNIIFPYVSEKLHINNSNLGGSWLISLLNELKNNNKIDKIGIFTVYSGKKYIKLENEKLIYYLIPCKNINKYSKKVEEYCKTIIADFLPDLIHIHGVEFPHSLAIINASKNIKKCVSIQGLISKCGNREIYNAGINSSDMFKSVTLRDIIRLDLLPFQYKKFLKKAKYELLALKKSKYIIGRTDWDKINTYLINKNRIYFHNNENMRKIFYNKKWDINKIERNSIYFSQASYPLKGFHKLLFAINQLKSDYPNIKVYVAGIDITRSNENFCGKIKLNGYGKYLKKLITQLNLKDNIKFLGYLNEEQVCEYLLKCNVYVQSSSLENSPNSLGEAMLIGMPCIASYVGGTINMITHEESGFLYPFDDVELLIHFLKEIFDDDVLAEKIGKNACNHAMKIFNKNKNVEELINIYTKVLND